ncbi:hypothetical protein DPEC_G00002870 [Dallia pectoralis]|uniref:Uncharacterized protein n=1 Tax=Dallia pectoralis TaxID=75939 RepID=A0ACC2HJL6_DALPE|nr:hypothetical protein DPEC_G00002870 [Dallia pectoralis]
MVLRAWLPVWLTASYVSHFRLDSAAHGDAPPCFLSLPSRQPDFNACTASGHSNPGFFRKSLEAAHSHGTNCRPTGDTAARRCNDNIGTPSLGFRFALPKNEDAAGMRRNLRDDRKRPVLVVSEVLAAMMEGQITN